MIVLWERQSDYDEGTADFAAFIRYRDQDPNTRSLKDAALNDPAGRSPEVFRMLYGKWNWDERSAAWDDHQDKVRIQRNRDLIAAEDQEHLKVAQAITKLCMDAAQLIEPESVGPQYLPRLIATAAQLSHAATGKKGGGAIDAGARGPSPVEAAIAELTKEMASKDSK